MTQQTLPLFEENDNLGPTPFKLVSAVNDNAEDAESRIAELEENAQSERFVKVFSESDFGDTGTNLVPNENTRYELQNYVEQTKSMIPAQGMVITSVSQLNSGPDLEYTGSSDQFVSNGNDYTIRDCVISCPNGQAYNNTNCILVLTNVEHTNIKSVGTFDSSILVTNTLTISGVTGSQGIVMLGASQLSIFKMFLVSTNPGFTGIDLTGATMIKLELQDYNPVGPLGSVGIRSNGSPDIQTGVDARCWGGFQSPSDMQPLDGFTEQDPAWDFLGNGFAVRNTEPGISICLENNAIPTLITTPFVAVKAAGVWDLVPNVISQYTWTTDGTLVRDGEREILQKINLDADVLPVSGGASDVLVELRVNGAVVTQSIISATPTRPSSTSRHFPILAKKDLITPSNSTTVEVWIGSDGPNVILVNAVLTVGL